MANKKEKTNTKIINQISDKMDRLDQQMDDIYQSTYSSRTSNTKYLQKLSDDIYDTVDTVLANNTNITGISNVARLYTRLEDKKRQGKSISGENFVDLTDVFTNKQLMNTISANPEINQYVKSLDMQYDMICKYMPKLEEALDIKKDNVLSSDNFTKEYINVTTTGSNTKNEDVFSQRVMEINKKYNFPDLCESLYKKASKYGEDMVYIVPYKKAFEQLMKSKAYNMTGSMFTPNNIHMESHVICENGKIEDTGKGDPVAQEILEKLSNTKSNVNLELDKTGLLSEAVISYYNAHKIKETINTKYKSVYESYNESVNENSSIKFDKTIPDELDYGDELKNVANDGLVSLGKNGDNRVNIDEIPGCIVRRIPHENIIPLYVENMCIGYYYMEFNFEDEQERRNSIVNSSSFPSHAQDLMQTENEELIKYLAANISNCINSNFINNNQDLKEEIYVMLKYNDKFNIDYNSNNIKVSFLPVEDMFHFYFEMDEKTHRGISDLQKSLIPAMFWCLLDLSTTLGIVTRSQDKRIYYVKQTVDTNVSKSLMNVINQVKKGNMGIRQMESMNNILNIVGRFNDHVIPQGPNGDSPIQFEVMQGQNIETPTDLMNKWEEAAINPTDVPLELINSVNQVDYAIRFTMSNSKFLRKVFKRQFICEEKFSELFKRIYNYEYGESETGIKISLPAPMFLTMTNGAQLIGNTREYVEAIANIEYPEDSPERAMFIKMMLRKLLPTHVNLPLVDELKKEADIRVAVTTKKEEE